MGQQLCSTPHLYEDEIKQRFVNAFSVFFQGKDLILETVQTLIESLSDTSELDAKIESLKKPILPLKLLAKIFGEL